VPVRERTAGRDGSLEDPALYFNRELSWLDFNLRVLELAEDPSVPLAERLRFCAIYTSNLDEFFMVRVAGLHDQLDAGVNTPGPDGHTPSQTIAAIRERVLAASRRLAACFEEQLRPLLAKRGIEIVGVDGLTKQQRGELRARFQRAIFPALTPLAVAPGRPFPYISNLSLSLAVLVRDPQAGQSVFARVKVPIENLPRFICFEQGRAVKLVPLEDAIAYHLEELFPGMEIVTHSRFRVTRDADLEVSDDAADLLQAVEAELRRRRFGEVVRVEVAEDCKASLLAELRTLLGVDDRDVYPTPSLLDMRGLEQVARLPALAGLRFPHFAGVTNPRLLRHEGEAPDVFAAMREGDILVHHPYDSFATSVERFVEQAVEDPEVLAIKQTLYRTSDDSRLVPALIEATERGKQAVALVELQARFDERRNIRWARALEQAGVHVVYGQPQLKTHVKCVLVVRREGDGVRNYVHIGTGNYNSATARLYTDFGLFTTDPEIGADVAELFNYLTGFARPHRYRRILTAPENLRDGVLTEISRTIAAAKASEPARIAVKINALVDPLCIRALYAASQAGVQVDLNVRGICCLRPGVPGVSERIRVVSIVGRFLEHSRIYLFQRGEQRTVYIASADLMPRNLDHRVEAAVPIAEPALQEQLIDVLERAFADNTNAWELGSDGIWRRRRPAPGEPRRNLQQELIDLHNRLAAQGPAAPPLPRRRPEGIEAGSLDGAAVEPTKPLR